MIRLIIIRLFESVFRNFILILSPAIVVTILFGAFQLVQKSQYLSWTTIQIRYNREISKVIGYEKFETDPKDPSERMVFELYELMGTDAFVDNIIDNVDFTDHTGVNPVGNSRSAMREYLRDNISFQPTGLTQIGMAVYMPTVASAVDVQNLIYDAYLTHQIETFGGSGRDLVNFMSIYLEAKTVQRDKVTAELNAYLETHPEHPVFDRRDIEEAQIAFLMNTRDDLTRDIEYTEDILDRGFLVEGTSERYFKETFILLDAPSEPQPTTSISQKLVGVVQGGVLGLILSFVVIGLIVMFDRRITLPLDLQHATDLPLLTMVVTETDRQKQRYNFKSRRLSLNKRVADRLKQIFHINRNGRPVRQHKNRRLNTN